MITPDSWIWQGYPAHFIGADKCRFRLCTRVGNWVISTVGAYYPDGNRGEAECLVGRGPDEIARGWKPLFETYVFPVKCNRQDDETCAVADASYNELPEEDAERALYETAKEAREGHMALCYKYAEREQ